MRSLQRRHRKERNRLNARWISQKRSWERRLRNTKAEVGKWKKSYENLRSGWRKQKRRLERKWRAEIRRLKNGWANTKRRMESRWRWERRMERKWWKAKKELWRWKRNLITSSFSTLPHVAEHKTCSCTRFNSYGLRSAESRPRCACGTQPHPTLGTTGAGPPGTPEGRRRARKAARNTRRRSIKKNNKM